MPYVLPIRPLKCRAEKGRCGNAAEVYLCWRRRSRGRVVMEAVPVCGEHLEHALGAAQREEIREERDDVKRV